MPLGLRSRLTLSQLLARSSPTLSQYGGPLSLAVSAQLKRVSDKTSYPEQTDSHRSGSSGASGEVAPFYK